MICGENVEGTSNTATVRPPARLAFSTSQDCSSMFIATDRITEDISPNFRRVECQDYGPSYTKISGWLLHLIKNIRCMEYLWASQSRFLLETTNVIVSLMRPSYDLTGPQLDGELAMSERRIILYHQVALNGHET